jgi:hypothetical protein
MLSKKLNEYLQAGCKTMSDEPTLTNEVTTPSTSPAAYPVVVKAVWEPFGEEAEEVVANLIKQAHWPTIGPKAIRYRVMVASFLKAMQDVHLRHSNSRNDNKVGPFLGVRWRNDAWSMLPLVGKDLAKKIIPELLQHFDAKQIEGSGSSNLFKDEEGKWSTDPIMSMYEIDLSKASALSALRFIETGLPLIKVNEAESRRQRDARKADKKAKPFLKNTKAKALFGDLLRASESRIERLNVFWRKHPIVLPNGHAAASATRVYHDGRMDAGGRLYGAWTGLDKATKRLHCRIDGEPICELDIRASQPTLFSSLLGYRVGGLGKGDTWGDVYAELSSLWAVNTWWSEHDPLIDKIDLIRRNRKVAKGVVVALIGSGNSLKAKASNELAIEHGLTQSGWLSFRDTLIRTIPALECLEPRYDKDGNLTGYMNGAGFLSYHESEIMMLTLERLVDQGIPAYPVHDCLLVKVSDVEQAAYVFRDTIREYCLKLSGLEVLVPLSIEAHDRLIARELINEEELMGIYLN